MMIDRRDLLQRASLLLGGALSSGAAMGVLAGCAATPQAAVDPTFLTSQEMRTTTIMAELIIPRTTTPGAVDVGVPAFIDRMLGNFYATREQSIMRAGLARAETDSQAVHGRSFKDLAPAEQTALMTIYDREAFNLGRQTVGQTDAPPHFFRLMKELTTIGFFTSRVGASEVLAYAAVPGPWRADIPYSEIGRAWAT